VRAACVLVDPLDRAIISIGALDDGLLVNAASGRPGLRSLFPRRLLGHSDDETDAATSELLRVVKLAPIQTISGTSRPSAIFQKYQRQQSDAVADLHVLVAKMPTYCTLLESPPALRTAAAEKEAMAAGAARRAAAVAEVAAQAEAEAATAVAEAEAAVLGVRAVKAWYEAKKAAAEAAAAAAAAVEAAAVAKEAAARVAVLRKAEAEAAAMDAAAAEKEAMAAGAACRAAAVAVEAAAGADAD